jgi:tetratricopeptide (TPR) repeat protein
MNAAIAPPPNKHQILGVKRSRELPRWFRVDPPGRGVYICKQAQIRTIDSMHTGASMKKFMITAFLAFSLVSLVPASCAKVQEWPVEHHGRQALPENRDDMVKRKEAAEAGYGKAEELQKSRRESSSANGPETQAKRSKKAREPREPAVIKMLKLGDEFLRDGLYDLAADEYAIAVRLEPQNPMARHKLGDAYQKMGALSEAAREYEEVIRLRPDSPMGYLGLGVVHSRKLEIEKAITLFQKGLSFAPQFALLHFELAVAYLKSDRLDQAISELEKTVALDKNRPEPGELLERVRQEKAAERGFVATETEHFILKSDPSQDRAFIDYTLKALQKAYEKLSKDLDFKPAEKIVVKLYPELKAFHGAASTPDWFTPGVASAKDNVIMLATPKREGNIEKFPKVVTHEVTHVFASLMTYGNLPVWLHEGIALYEADQWDRDREALLRKGLKTQTLLGLDALNRPFSELKNPEIASLAYAESYSTVKFILDRFGKESFLRFLKAFSAGKSLDRAALGSLGIDARTFEERWKDFLMERYGA